MNGCAAFSRIMWTCAKYTRSLKCLQTQQRLFYNFHVKSIFAVADCNSRTVSSESYTDSFRASLNHVKHMHRFCSNKADDDKTEVAKESAPGLLRRFHQTYKEHGKILICVHLVTSAVWAGVFYCVAVRYML